MSGELAKRLRPMMDQVAETLALVEAGIDFSDEDVTFLPAAEAADRARGIESELDGLQRESARFERLSHEVEFVLVGRPNAGKSTLLNALAGHERAVVSPVAGTTRDAISAEVSLKRGIVRITDVAGLDAAPGDEIECKMQSQARDAIGRADYVIEVRDPADASPYAGDRTPDIIIRTKADLHPGADVSAVTGQGMDQLKESLDALAFGRPSGSSLALNARHLAAIAEARRLLTRAADAAIADHPPEIIAFELRAALDAMGSIVGHITPDDVLGRVFATFCIGK
jgi:tRNA modification GTPase